MTRCSTGGGGVGVTVMFTACVTIGLRLSERRAVNDAVPLKPTCSVTVQVTFAVPWPAETTTDATPVPATADQLKTLLSSEPLRPALNGAESCATVAIGFAGAVIVGGLFGATTEMLTGVDTGGLTLSESVAVNVAVPVKPAWIATVQVTFAVPWPELTVTEVTPVPATADQT